VDESKSSDRRGRVTLINLPFELFEDMDRPGLAMHVYSRVVYLSRHDTITFKKGPREVTLQRGECVFYVRNFCSRWGYQRPHVTQVVKALEKLGFWTITDTHDGFTIRVRPLQKVPGFAAAQVYQLNRVSNELILEARRDFLREQLKALAAADRGLYRGLESEFKAISDSYNTCNATEKPGSVPVNINQILKDFETGSTLRKNSPASAGPLPSAPSGAEAVAPEALQESKCGPSALSTDQGSENTEEGPSGAASEWEGGFFPPKGLERWFKSSAPSGGSADAI
jgi:hypothetical protein